MFEYPNFKKIFRIEKEKEESYFNYYEKIKVNRK